MEELHNRRRLLDVTWQRRKHNLEKYRTLTILKCDLELLETLIRERYELLSRSRNELGNSASEAELLLEQHLQLVPEATVNERSCKNYDLLRKQFLKPRFMGPRLWSKKVYSFLCSLFALFVPETASDFHASIRKRVGGFWGLEIALVIYTVEWVLNFWAKIYGLKYLEGNRFGDKFGRKDPVVLRVINFW